MMTLVKKKGGEMKYSSDVAFFRCLFFSSASASVCLIYVGTLLCLFGIFRIYLHTLICPFFFLFFQGRRVCV